MAIRTTISSRPVGVRDYLSPLKMVKNLWKYREMIGQFTRREVLQRYKGSFLGIIWSFITPLTTLCIYTFVFSVIFKATWRSEDSRNPIGYALPFFAGLIAFTMFSESTLAAPRLITGNPNLVKRVVFPLEILSVSQVGAALISSLFSLTMLVVGALVFYGRLPATLFLLPLMYVPLVLLCLGLSWFFASLGVYLRDLGPFLGVVVQMLFFLSPVVYSTDQVPAQVQFILYLNPLTFILNHFRRVILFGQMPDWGEYLVLVAWTFVICQLGYIWFMKSKKTFADVI